MKYAVIKSKVVDFDISRGNQYEEWIEYLDNEKAAFKHAANFPDDVVIRYEPVRLVLAAESDLVQPDD